MYELRTRVKTFTDDKFVKKIYSKFTRNSLVCIQVYQVYYIVADIRTNFRFAEISAIPEFIIDTRLHKMQRSGRDSKTACTLPLNIRDTSYF